MAFHPRGAFAMSRHTPPRPGPPRPGRGLLVVAAALLVLPACGGSDPSVEAPFTASPWAVEGPEVRIGSVDDPRYAFTDVGDLAAGPDGRLYSLHPQETVVRRWTRDGEPDGTMGGEGEGPGEFTRPRSLGFFGDSLWVMDQGLYRVTYFDPDGEVLGSVSPSFQMGRPDSEEPWASPPRPSRPLRDGTFLAVSPAWSQGIALGELTSVPYVRMSADGEVLSTIWRRPYRSTDVLALLREDGGTFGSQPFGDQPLSAVAPEGALVVVDRRAHAGEGAGTFSVSRIAMSGDTVFRREFRYEPVALSGARADSVTRARAEGLHGFMSRRQPDLSLARLEADVGDAMYVPEHLPPLAALEVASDGTIWLERFEPAEDGSREWWILHPDGEPAGRAFLPEGLEIHRITGEGVLGVESDEMGVDYIVRYRVEP